MRKMSDMAFGHRRRFARLTLGLTMMAAPSQLCAQQAPSLPSSPESRSFTPADFARFAPRNALDMLRQVPGFAIREAAQERGLGEATGNVLVNGRRIPGKSSDVATELSRIPAQNVTRIEIMDGATLDVPGLVGQVANVITTAPRGRAIGQFSWNPEFRMHSAPPLWTRFDLSVSGAQGDVEWTLGLDNQASRGGARGATLIFGAAGTLIEVRDEVMSSSAERPRITGRLKISGPGTSIANLNLSYRRNYFDFREGGTRTGPGMVDRERIVTAAERGHSYEVGGDYEFTIGSGRAKLIALQRSSHQPTATDVVTTFSDFSPDTGNRFLGTGDMLERIGRVEYRWNAGGSDWQISGEGAFNRLDNVSQLFELLPGRDLKEIPLPGGSARVAEDRYEIVGSYGRRLAPNLSMQLSIGAEHSSLSHIAAMATTGSYFRPKGQFSIAWEASATIDASFKLQRRVGQLNFYDFLAAVNFSEERQNTGNPDLLPPQSWEAEMEMIANLGRWGTTSLRVYGHLIEDTVDIIPIGATGESPGNVDRALLLGAEWKTTFNFDPLGWRGAKLNARVQLQASRLEDPLTGESREISNSLMQLVDVNLRHDLPGTDWAWGGGAYYENRALSYRPTEVSKFWEGPVFANLFVEHKDVLGLTVRATIGNILGGDSMAERFVYLGRRTGPLNFFEKRDREIGPIVSFSVAGRL